MKYLSSRATALSVGLRIEKIPSQIILVVMVLVVEVIVVVVVMVMIVVVVMAVMVVVMIMVMLVVMVVADMQNVKKLTQAEFLKAKIYPKNA